MRRKQRFMQTATTVFVLCGLVVASRPPIVQADTATTPSLVVSQLKITSSDGQFVTLFNTTSTTLDMSKYQLLYYNNYDLSKATSSRLIALSGMVPPHSYYMVNDGALLLCYKLTINSVSLGFSSTTGFVQVLALQQSSPGSSVSSVLQDYVGWSKTSATGVQQLPSKTTAFLQRLPLDDHNNPAVTEAGNGTWQQVQPSNSDACSLVTSTAGASLVQTGLGLLLPSSEPPATIVSESSDEAAPTAVLAASNFGLMAPQITELLPNPNGTGTDATEEYIELYNFNSVNFDLTGFALQSGTASLRSYVFPAGTTLPPKSFVAFYADTTNLSLSNTSGQVKLLDPFGNPIAHTDAYAAAKDGQSWALANGKWYWSTSPTANGANVIKQPLAKKTKTTSTKTKSTASGSSATGPKIHSGVKPTALAGSIQDGPTKTPIHPRVLALIAGLALLYGAYEYRADMANRIYQLRRYIIYRRENRSKA